MIKKDLIKIFNDENCSKPPKKKCPTNKIVYNFSYETWSTDLADFSEYKTSNNKGFRYIIIIIDNSSKYVWVIPLKKKNSKIVTEAFSNISSTSKRSPLKIESDRGAEFYNSIFQKFSRTKNIHHDSRFTDEGPSIAERVTKTLRKLLKKPVFLAGNADWSIKLQSVVKKCNKTIHSSTKMEPVDAYKKSNEKLVYSNLRDDRDIQTPKFKLGQLIRTADIKLVFSEGDSTNYSYELYTIIQKIHDTIPTYRVNYLPERYEEILLLPTKLSVEQNNQVLKELNQIQ